MTEYIIEQVHKLILDKMEGEELNLESKEALKSVLQEYSIHIKLIEQQLEMCKKDHAELQSEISKLVEENRALTQQLKIASEKAILRGEGGQSRQSLLSEECENTMHQLSLALDEKHTLEALWKSSINESESLKEKLREYESGKQLTRLRNKLNDVQRDYTEAIQILESKLSALKAENDRLIAKNDLVEKQLLQSTAQMVEITEKSLSVSNMLKDVSSHEQEWKSKCLLLEAKYLELDKAYQTDKVKFARVYEYEKVETHLKEKLEVALRQRDDLQCALERCHESMTALRENAANDRSRIEEAVGLVDEALKGRDEALAREATSVEEMVRMKGELDKLVGAAGQRVGEEVAAVRNQFQQLITTLREELQLAKQERDRKSKEAHQWQQECERLQSLQGQLEGVSEPLRGDRRQLAKAYEELEYTECECRQLQLENEQLQYSLAQLQERCRKNARVKSKLKSELKHILQQYQICQHELAMTVERADLVSSQLQQTNLELTQLQSQTILNRNSMANYQAKVSVADTLELYKRFDDSYGQMNDKWKNEITVLTEKFEAKLKKAKKRSKTQTPPEEDIKDYE